MQQKKISRHQKMVYWVLLEWDGTFWVDHLMRAGTGDEIWQGPHGTDDIQDTIEQQIVPVTWNVSSRKPHFVLSNAIEIEDIFREIC